MILFIAARFELDSTVVGAVVAGVVGIVGSFCSSNAYQKRSGEISIASQPSELESKIVDAIDHFQNEEEKQ